MTGSFSNNVFYAETTYASYSGEQTEELTITMDTLTGVMSNLEYHRVFEGPTTHYEISISVSDIERTFQSYNSLTYADSGMASCTHINTLDWDYDNYEYPGDSYTVTNFWCYEDSRIKVDFLRF